MLDRIALVWLKLLVLTSAGFIAGEESWSVAAAVLIASCAAYKATLIILDFMEMREAPHSWRWLYLGWAAVMSTILVCAGFA